MRDAGAVSANTEEYLEWIYRLSKEQEKITPTDLARNLKVSPASVTNMLKRLTERDLIHYQPYKGITLTDGGRRVGARIIRRHGLLERLLCDVLGFPWHKVDDAVRHLEHYITEEVEERLDRHLGHPKTCPHGQPLDWETADESIRLSELGPGQSATVARIGNEDEEFLGYVQTLGLLPEVGVTIISAAPFGGPVTLRVGETEHAVGEAVLHNIWILRSSITPGA